MRIDTGIEFHKNGVFMKKEYLYGLMDDGFTSIDKEWDRVWLFEKWKYSWNGIGDYP